MRSRWGSAIVLPVDGATYRGLPGTEKEVARMKRITMSVTVVMVMAAMLVASAMPAFADKGGGGHSTNEGDCVAEACQFVTTEAGNRKAEEGYAGRYSSTETSDFSSDPP